MLREHGVTSHGRIGLAVLAGIGLAGALGGCATAGGAHRHEAPASGNAPAPAISRAPEPATAPAPEPATAPVPEPAAATAPALSTAPLPPDFAAQPAVSMPPAAQAGVAPDDPKIDEALGGLGSKTPSGCRKYVNAWCRTTTIPDAYRLQACVGYVKAINSFVTQMRESRGGSAIDSCDAMAQGKLPQ